MRNYAFISFLVENRINFNVKNSVGNTPLHAAISMRDEKMVSLLLKGITNPYLNNSEGIDCFGYAMRFMQPSIIASLVEDERYTLTVENIAELLMQLSYKATQINKLQLSESLRKLSSENNCSEAQRISKCFPFTIFVRPNDLEQTRLAPSAGGNIAEAEVKSTPSGIVAKTS